MRENKPVQKKLTDDPDYRLLLRAIMNIGVYRRLMPRYTEYFTQFKASVKPLTPNEALFVETFRAFLMDGYQRIPSVGTQRQIEQWLLSITDYCEEFGVNALVKDIIETERATARQAADRK